MNNLFKGFFVVSLCMIIWLLYSINNGIHHLESQLDSIDNNIYEIEMHTSGLEKPEEIMARRELQQKTIKELHRFMPKATFPFSLFLD